MKKELLLSAFAAILVATCFGTTAANADNAETETDIKTNIKAEESTEIKADEKIALAGFATFEIKEKPEREGINPLTKEKIKIAASKTPVVKFGKAFKDKFN